MISAKRFCKQAVVTLASASMLAAFALPAGSMAAAPAPETLYVSTTGSDSSATGTMSAPYATIQAAVDAAVSGATVVVEPGTYKGEVKIMKDITLRSDATQPDAAKNTIIDATGQYVGLLIEGSSAAGTVVHGITVEHANNHGVLVLDTNNVTIEDSIVEDNGLSPDKQISENKGLQLAGTSDSLVYNNIVTDNKADGGIGVTDDGQFNSATGMAGTALPGNGNLILDNVDTNNQHGCGIVIASYNPGEGVAHNVAFGNTESGSPAGIVVAADPPGTSAVDNVVSDNTVSHNFIPGIIVHSNAPGQTVSGTVITGNTVSYNGADPDAHQAKTDTTGIILIGVVDAVTNTTIANNTISNEHFGIWSSNTSGTIETGNTVDAASVDLATYPIPFSDVSAGSFDAAAADALYARGFWSGTSTMLEGLRAITRAQFVTLVLKAIGDNATAKTSFTDVPASYWAAGQIGEAVKLGIVSGFTTTTFKPDATLTRAQAAKILSLAFKLKNTGKVSPFTDVPKDAWYAPYVTMMWQNGDMMGVTTTQAAPQATMTRAQAITLLYRMVGQ